MACEPEGQLSLLELAAEQVTEPQSTALIQASKFLVDLLWLGSQGTWPNVWAKEGCSAATKLARLVAGRPSCRESLGRAVQIRVSVFPSVKWNVADHHAFIKEQLVPSDKGWTQAMNKGSSWTWVCLAWRHICGFLLFAQGADCREMRDGGPRVSE